MTSFGSLSRARDRMIIAIVFSVEPFRKRMVPISSSTVVRIYTMGNYKAGKIIIVSMTNCHPMNHVKDLAAPFP